jgi:hypothetical protein
MTTLPRPGSSRSVSLLRRSTALTGLGAAVLFAAACAAPARAEPSRLWWRAPAEIATPSDVPGTRLAVDDAAIDFVLAPPRGAVCARIASAARAPLLRQVAAIAGRLGGTTIVAATPPILVRTAAIARRSLRAEHILRAASNLPKAAARAAPAPVPARQRAASGALPAAMARREPAVARTEHASNRLISGAALAFLALVLLVPPACSVAATAAAGPTRAPPGFRAARVRAVAAPRAIAPCTA